MYGSVSDAHSVGCSTSSALCGSSGCVSVPVAMQRENLPNQRIEHDFVLKDTVPRSCKERLK